MGLGLSTASRGPGFGGLPMAAWVQGLGSKYLNSM